MFLGSSILTLFFCSSLHAPHSRRHYRKLKCHFTDIHIQSHVGSSSRSFTTICTRPQLNKLLPFGQLTCCQLRPRELCATLGCRNVQQMSWAGLGTQSTVNYGQQCQLSRTMFHFYLIQSKMVNDECEALEQPARPRPGRRLNL